MATERILIVDDDRSVRDGVSRVLRGKGFKIEIADEPAIALDVLGDFQPDLVLTDVYMPGMDGVALARAIKKQCPDTGLIAMTGHASMASAVEFLKLGADDYLRKPVPMGRLIASIQMALEKREAKLGRRTEDEREEPEQAPAPEEQVPDATGAPPTEQLSLEELEARAAAQRISEPVGDAATRQATIDEEKVEDEPVAQDLADLHTQEIMLDEPEEGKAEPTLEQDEEAAPPDRESQTIQVSLDELGESSEQPGPPPGPAEAEPEQAVVEAPAEPPEPEARGKEPEDWQQQLMEDLAAQSGQKPPPAEEPSEEPDSLHPEELMLEAMDQVHGEERIPEEPVGSQTAHFTVDILERSPEESAQPAPPEAAEMGKESADRAAEEAIVGPPEAQAPAVEPEEMAAEEEASGEPPTAPFPNYEIVEDIVRGEMGDVFKAKQLDPPQVVALKVVPQSAFASQEEEDRFLQEARAAAALFHPGIVPIHDIAEVQGNYCFAMEYVEGETLDEYIKTRKGGVEGRLKLFLEICKIVAYAHSQSVLHRDLKPSNIVIDRGGNVRITDFGLARLAETVPGHEDTEVMMSSVVVGTLAYMSPEQTLGSPEKMDERSDVYSLGVILYEMLTDTRPYFVDVLPDPIEALDSIRKEDPKPPSEVVRTLEGRPEDIILKALAKAKEDRYQSVAELAADVNRLVGVGELGEHPAAVGPATHRRMRALQAAIVLVLLSMLAFVWVRSARRGRQAEEGKDKEREPSTAAALDVGKDEGRREDAPPPQPEVAGPKAKDDIAAKDEKLKAVEAETVTLQAELKVERERLRQAEERAKSEADRAEKLLAQLQKEKDEAEEARGKAKAEAAKSKELLTAIKKEKEQAAEAEERAKVEKEQAKKLLAKLEAEKQRAALAEPEPKPQDRPEAQPRPQPEGKPEPKAKPEPTAKPAPENVTEPKPVAKPEPEAKPEIKPAPKETAQPKPEAKPEIKPAPKETAQPKPEAKPEPRPGREGLVAAPSRLWQREPPEKAEKAPEPTDTKGTKPEKKPAKAMPEKKPVLVAKAKPEDVNAMARFQPPAEPKPEPMENELVAAAKTGNLARATNLLAKGADINAKDGTGATALHWAAARGPREMAELLIVHGADVNARDQDGMVPLHKAVWNSHEEIGRLLIGKGTEVSLHLVAAIAEPDRVEMLMADGAAVDARDGAGMTPLHWAARTGNHSVVDFLVTKGADVNAESKDKLTPLDVAEMAARRGIADFLRKHKGKSGVTSHMPDPPAPSKNVNKKDRTGTTPLHEAAASGGRELAAVLISRGADVNAQNNEGMTPLHLAALGGHKGVAELLIENGADLNAKEKNGMTALDIAEQFGGPDVAALIRAHGAKAGLAGIELVMAARKGDMPKVMKLLDEGAEVNATDSSGSTALHKAAGHGHLEIAWVLIRNGADVNAKDNLGMRPLHEAVWEGHKEVGKLLISKGATVTLHIASGVGRPNKVAAFLSGGVSVDAKDLASMTPLHWAAHCGNREVIEFLVRQGAFANAKDNRGVTPLYLAAGNADKRVVSVLLDRGADVNAGGAAGTPLHVAVFKGRTDVVELLLAKGADVNAREETGGTPLHLAAANGQKDVAALLINSGADVNTKEETGSTPLHVAAGAGSRDVANLLVRYGADVNASNAFRVTPLHEAALAGRREMVEFLIDKKADVNAKDEQGKTPLRTAIANGNLSVAALLVGKGAALEAREGKKGQPAAAADEGAELRAAALLGDKEKGEALIARGVDVQSRDGDGLTALYWAAYRGNPELVGLLIAKGADVNVKAASGATPLHLAVRCAGKETAELLVGHGADVNAKDDRGVTPLHEAASWGREETAKLLIEKGADVNARTRDGTTPLSSAMASGHLGLAQFLQSKGAKGEAAQGEKESKPASTPSASQSRFR